MQDIGQMKSLLPSLITFAYIDSELLRIHAAGNNEVDPRRRDKMQELDEEYERAARAPTEGEDGEDAPAAKPSKKDVVLIFKFNDGELKSSNGVGKVITRKWQYVGQTRRSHLVLTGDTQTTQRERQAS